jgi:hypothetical protein
MPKTPRLHRRVHGSVGFIDSAAAARGQFALMLKHRSSNEGLVISPDIIEVRFIKRFFDKKQLHDLY